MVQRQELSVASKTPRQRNTDSISNNFLVIIKSTVHGTVVARLPEEVQMQLSSEWDTPFLQGSGNQLVEVAAQTIFNVSTKTQLASGQVWSGSTPIELTLPLDFYADENSTLEVIEPVVKLAKMALPRLSGGIGGFYTSPGPRIFPRQKNPGDNITIKLGNFLNFKQVIVVSVNPNFVVRDLTPTGEPLRCSCDITFRSMYTLTGNELQSQFTGLAAKSQ